MAIIGAKDKIDRMLVKKYASVKMDNYEANKMVDAQKMLDTMNDYAQMQRDMLNLCNKLKGVCDGVTAKSAFYMRSKPRVPRPQAQ